MNDFSPSATGTYLHPFSFSVPFFAGTYLIYRYLPHFSLVPLYLSYLDGGEKGFAQK
jgi:hypothetical protein